MITKLINAIHKHLNPTPTPLTEEQQAELNWTRHNEEAQKAGCFVCGKPAPHIFENHENVGRVPYQSFTCDEHKGANGWYSHNGGEHVATYDRSTPCKTCTNKCGGILAYEGENGTEGEQHTWFCTIRAGDETP